MNMDIVLLVIIGMGCVLTLGLALAWTVKLTRDIPSNFDALEFDDIQSCSKSYLWWK